MELPCEKEKKPYKLRAIQDHTPSVHQESRDNDDYTNGPSCACALVRHKSEEGIRESDDQDLSGVHKIK
jgi:hypothetical protein